MSTVHVLDRAGERRVIEAEDDLPLMVSLREAGLPVEGACGGTASCGTCHVYADPEWLDRLDPPDASESDMLGALEHYRPASSRLSCQITITEALDGFVVTLAPEEFV